MFRVTGDRQAPIFLQGSQRRWESEANSEAAVRRERTDLMSGYVSVGPSTLHAGSAIGWLTPRPWERRMLQIG